MRRDELIPLLKQAGFVSFDAQRGPLPERVETWLRRMKHFAALIEDRQRRDPQLRLVATMANEVPCAIPPPPRRRAAGGGRVRERPMHASSGGDRGSR